jgi:NADH-quinone oxidoreductase subunit J
MSLGFFILAALTLASAVAAMSLRNLVHCALSLIVTFGGLAAFYLQLNAQFVGFAQILVYIGAVAILVVFAILLTGRGEAGTTVFSPSWLIGAAVAALVFGALAAAILGSKAIVQKISPPHSATVKQIGDELMSRYVLPLEVLGLLLTAALLGAVIIALQERRES